MQVPVSISAALDIYRVLQDLQRDEALVLPKLASV